MKNLFTLFLSIIVFSASFAATAYAVNVSIPQSTAYGQIPVGNAVGGSYTPTATSSINFFALTTTGSSGAATYSGGTLNIPQYSGSGGSGTVSTSTNETPGSLAYWTSSSATPALLGKVATSSITYSSPLTTSGTAGYIVGGSGYTIGLDTTGTWSGNAGTASALAANGSNCPSGFFPLGVTAGGVSENCTYAFASTTPWSAGVLVLSNTGLGYTVSTSTLFGATTPGYVLSYQNGAWGAYATSTGVGGGVTAVTATAPIFSSGGATPNITWGGLATTSQPASSNLLVSNGAAGVYGVATSTATLGLNLSGSITGLGSSNSLSIATSTLYGASTGGMVLGWNNATGGIGWVATSSASGTNFFSNSGNNTWLTTGTNFGIGSSTPWATLSVGISNYSATQPMFAISSSTANGTTTPFIVTNNGKVGIGTTTPWANLSIADSNYTYTNPLFAISTSTGVFGRLFTVFATSSVIQKTDTGRNDSGARVSIGASPFVDDPELDQLEVEGRINQKSLYMGCDFFAGSTTQLTGDGDRICSQFMFNEDTAAVFDPSNTNSSVPYGRIRTGTAGVITAANDGGSITTVGGSAGGNVTSPASTTPIGEIIARIGVPQNATSSIYFLGFTDNAGNQADLETLPLDACAFTASSTASGGTWYLLSRASGGATYVNTGVASSTNVTGVGDFYKFRIEASRNTCIGYITNLRTGVVTKTVNTAAMATWPNTVGFLASVANTAAGLTKELHVRSMRLWISGYDEPQ